MRSLRLALVILIIPFVFGSFAHCQSVVPEPDIDGVVREAYDVSSQFLIYSTTQKAFIRGGDGVAVVLTHLIGQVKANDLQIERVCSIIEISFSHPDFIVNPKNRTPDVSLLLLESTRMRSKDPVVQGKLATIESHLLSLYKKAD